MMVLNRWCDFNTFVTPDLVPCIHYSSWSMKLGAWWSCDCGWHCICQRRKHMFPSPTSCTYTFILLSPSLACLDHYHICNEPFILTPPSIPMLLLQKYKRTALLLASENGHTEIVKVLLTVPGINVNLLADVSTRILTNPILCSSSCVCVCVCLYTYPDAPP